MLVEEVKTIIEQYWKKNYKEDPQILQVRKHEDYFIIDTVRGSLPMTVNEIERLK